MTTNPKSEVHNVDCLDFMRGLPDNAFDLAIADPPYGDGKSGDGELIRWNGSGRQAKYRNAPPPTIQPLRRALRPLQERGWGGGNQGTTPSDCGRKTGPTRTGGTRAGKYAKKSSSGTRPPEKTFSRNFAASHAIKSSGARIIFPECRRRVASRSGTNSLSPRTSRWRWRSTRGRRST